MELFVGLGIFLEDGCGFELVAKDALVVLHLFDEFVNSICIHEAERTTTEGCKPDAEHCANI